ncbi:thioesterase family protein [Natranaerobius thermophilus]|uniref:Thioesterase superfamily n=1 Tax=Natranaerobius thermophilus (strain ATCC BAA-1301 / DSM 18059 / JW/NM-WN-LF) TaxID=457570 RepID=B2A5Z4_NATTJ|nr:thioesterase family protein [Natranaerobius thermophilus]ACB85411.1 Thioesterase superfamily [Natranaerobius thermophilus JW/NM-WN-LF]
MQVGDRNEIVKEVSKEFSAKEFGSGSVDVLATPAMIAFMEEAALKLVDSQLDEDRATVGSLVNVKHLAPTPVGDKVKVNAVLKEVDGKRLVFEVTAHDSNNKIGEGEHERFIINLSKFMNKLS